MADNPLKMAPKGAASDSWLAAKGSARDRQAARFEREWLIYPAQFQTDRNAAERDRIARMLTFVQKYADLNGLTVADLGTGDGTIARHLRDLGATVHTVDIAANALALMRQHDMERIELFHDYVPRTKLTDSAYDLVVACDLIAYLPKEEMRLFMSECARLVTREGWAIVSTPIDINSDDALRRFAELSETEFLLEEWSFAHHKYWLRLLDFFSAPKRFVSAYRNPHILQHKLSARQGLSHSWFRINASPPLVYLWMPIAYLLTPLTTWLQQSTWLLNTLNRLCSAISPIRGVTHAAWIGRRRPLIERLPEEPPIERKGKKQVWE